MQRKILILYYSSHTVCGIGTWLELLAPELEANGWEVTIGLAWGREFHDPAKIEACRPGFRTVWMDGRTGTEEGRVLAICRAIKQVDPEIVILNCLDSAFEAIQRVRNEGRDLRLVVTNHGNFSHQAAALLSHRDEIDLAVCIGRQSMAVMGMPPWGFDAERLVHLPNAVQGTANENESHGSALRVGFAGRLDSEGRKRVRDTIPFFQRLHELSPSAELWIAGDGNISHEIKEFANQFPEHVRCFGRLSREQLYRDFFPHLDVFVNFSSNEAFCLSIAEAMAHGVVPVTSEFFGLHDEGLVLPKVNALTFPVGDVEQAAILVAGLLNDSVERERMGDNARRHINENFSPHASGLRWSKALEECWARPSITSGTSFQTPRRRGKFGIPESWLERYRRLRHRYFPHQSGGEEWPHYRCRNSDLLENVSNAMGISIAPDAIPHFPQLPSTSVENAHLDQKSHQ
ncbi:glycosyltransferase family 4 protein [Stieleria varia]|uniref:UDP-D-galactose:(Glucosyl)lipopolysaccharide-1, 6-D-galactosyltransferase n=1 Tax=Stieleria varia TaxID=2528005 RepID=A0A5C6B374_9BACT|nr:glycosyltransferase family 4 protein [Stieleria varia]TWU05962.1 UDP-D-galactose:(glucosyl)lipopolysaccharide-1,6-D-galactosyltransferase [Stieleria varia]